MEVVNIKEISGEPAVRLDFPYSEKIINFIKDSIHHSERRFSKDHWVIHKRRVVDFISSLKSMGVSIRLSPVLQNALKLSGNGLTELEVSKMKHYKRTSPSYRVKKDINTDYLGMKLGIYNYQKSSLDFTLKRNGRVFIADDMGIGKTAQAIAIALHYRSDFPVIVIAQASLLFNWKKEFAKFTHIDPDDVNVISGKKKIKGKVIIISYDFAHKNYNRLSQYIGVKGIVIIDEAHNIKNKDAQKTPSIIKLSNMAKRCVVMTGTPFLSRPVESWTLLKCIQPNFYAWDNYNKFTERYCEGHLKQIKTYGKNGKEIIRKIYYDGGASNIIEYHNMIRDSVMIRRLRSDKGMLEDLPEMQRYTQHFELNDKAFNVLDDTIKKVRDIIDNKHKEIGDNRDLMKSVIYGELGEEGRSKILEAYRYSGISKIGSINEWIENWIENDYYDSDVDYIEGGKRKGKLIIFGHHKEFISAVEEHLKKLQKGKSFKYIKVDSSVSNLEKRFELGETFQKDDEFRIALLSIKVASVGLTLTAASDILFGEFPWTPAIAQQAEARAHRNGQENKVSCYYAIADNKIDGALWNLISFKSELSSSMIDGGLGDEMETSFNDKDMIDSLIMSEIDIYYSEIKKAS